MGLDYVDIRHFLMARVKVKAVRRKQGPPEERQIITGLITDPDFCRQIVPITRGQYFSAPFAQTVAEWCVDYWREYEDAPGQVIQDLFESRNREGVLDEDQAELIGRFLESISDEYDRVEHRSTEYLVKKTERYFKRRAYEILKQDISAAVSDGDVDRADELLAGFQKPERIRGGAINPFTDEEIVRDAFEHVVEPLFTLPGALGEALNDQMVRDAFVGIMGPEKRGKSWWLMYLSRRAAMKGNNVAHFVVGDMSQRQVVVRHHIMNTGRSHRKKYCQEILIPVLDCHYNQTGQCDRPEREGEGQIMGPDDKQPQPYEKAGEWWIPCTVCYKDRRKQRRFWKGAMWWKTREAVDPLNWREALKSGQKFMKRRMPGRDFKLSCHSRGSLSVSQIKSLLYIWEQEDGFVPDVIVVDYADNLAPEPEDARREFRHQQNGTWGALRALSQDYDCLVITATQADSQSYTQKTLNETNFSEDKRKYSHVTAMITLNQDPTEKRDGVMRIGRMFLREDDFQTDKTVTVLQCLAQGRPVIASFW